jgi:hypothetical protein
VISPWDAEFAVIEEANDLADCPSPEEGGEHQVEAVLHLLVGVLDHSAQCVADQANGEGLSQLAAPSLVEQSIHHPAPECVQLQFRDQSLEAED